MLSSEIFCANCGAANNPQDSHCFACHEPLQQADPEPTQIERLLRQRYRVLTRLGQGGMGSVYKAEDTELGNRLVAIKELSQKGLNQQESHEAEESFKHEALLLAGLMHPNLPRIYDNFSDSGRWYLVMDFIEGETLEDYLTRKGGKLSWSEIYEIGIQLCAVLQYLHTRPTPIIFRDLKPLNIMLTPGLQVYLIDFGIARLFKPGQAHDTIAFGSPGYAAPEQYGKAQTTPSADIYSLGAILHQMLTGIDPATTPFAFSKVPGIPVSLQSLLDQMLNLNASQRISYVEMVREYLQRVNTKNSSILSSGNRSTGTPTSNPPAKQATPIYTPPTPNQVAPINRATAANQPANPAATYPANTPGQAATSVPAYNIGTPRQPSLVYVPGTYSPDANQATSLPAGAGLPDPPIPTSYLGKLICGYSGHMGVVTSLAWSPYSNQIASASYDKTVQIWDINNGQKQNLYSGNLENAKSRRIEAVAWSPAGKLLASASDDGIIQVWNGSSLYTITTYKKQRGRIPGLAWSPDGALLASACKNSLHIWKPETGETLATLETGYGDINSIAWSPDNDRLILGHEEQHVEIMRLTQQHTWKRELLYTAHRGAIKKVSWSPDGTQIASGGSDKTIHIWEASTGKHSLVYRGHTGTIYALDWSPDGTTIVSASADGTIQMWDVSDGQWIFTHPSYNPTVYAVAWSPNGKYIASGAHSHVRIWQATEK
ncbi:serine/threonine-protein kinase [Dictyobacter kobayashii]|uniref:Protein kinase domain-containing protein n=1 Tax=Dictyobacter kobayashii TaxID=2014872 RepID=A0A402AIW4_9CHLR|nr:serine/threonine-protein kinase [Dictyobacter kobayashii]GCE19036.1 hypothetical protein KDK_28360 [Dictyobacter kobayashii]